MCKTTLKTTALLFLTIIFYQGTTIAALKESNFDIPTETTCKSHALASERITVLSEGKNYLTYPSALIGNSVFSYCKDQVDSRGSMFEIKYKDQGGSSMDGYVNGVIGGVKANGKWNAGNKELTGMPVKLKNLTDDLIIQWKVSQDDATGIDDKWMASINLIFDKGKAKKDPNIFKRHYDLVIEASRHNFKFDKNDITTGDKRQYLARNEDKTIKTFDIQIGENTYKYAVRYKFAYNAGVKNKKVHVKYIPIDEDNIPPYLNHSVKAFIDNSKDYIKFTDMPKRERKLAKKKVAKKGLYLKSIRAGYEVYRGQSTLRNDFFLLKCNHCN